MNPLRVVIADDHPQSLSLFQSLSEPEYRVVGTAVDGRSLVAAVQALQPDVVLTDIMPVMNDATSELHRILPDLCLIVHSSDARPDMMAAAYKAGASGYVIKGPAKSLVSSVRTLVAHLPKPLEVSAISTATEVYRPPPLKPPRPSPHQHV